MKIIKAMRYTIVFEQENYKSLDLFLQQRNYSSLFILVDEHTKTACLPIFLSKITLNYTLITIPSGENHKNLDTCIFVWEKLHQLQADRQSLLINIGGGMVTDIGGFIATTFKRGMDFINISTSLLGMVDASVGGKTGIDFNGLKNQIGVFSNPKMVVIDMDYIKSLPKREWVSGMAEIIKYGLSYDANLWQSLKMSAIDTINLPKLIHRSIEIKNEVVLKDPQEQALRKILNYGHTIGHAIETYFLQSDSKNSLTHGEAIAIGLICETYISSVLFNFPKDELIQLKKYILKLFGHVIFNENDFENILQLMKFDKKNINGNIRFVLLMDIAHSKIDCHVETPLIIESLKYYLDD